LQRGAATGGGGALWNPQAVREGCTCPTDISGEERCAAVVIWFMRGKLEKLEKVLCQSGTAGDMAREGTGKE
jgi:hypothetical protein